MNKSVSGIYVITNLKNGKKYVGQSCDVVRRIRTHKLLLSSGRHKNRHLQAAWDKYGAAWFSFEVIESCPIDDLNKREVFWIKHYNSFSQNGYNLTLGGDGSRGYRFPESTKQRLREIAKSRTLRYWLGKKLSTEHREKLREAAKNRSEEHLRKIGEASRRVMSDPDIKQKMISHQNNKAVFCRELGVTFYSIGDAARKTGLSTGNISKVCRGLIKKTGGYHWEFVDAL